MTNLELRKNFNQLSGIHRSECLANHIQGRRPEGKRDTLREISKKRRFVLGTIRLSVLIPFSFGILAFTPLRTCLATINELSTYCCLPFQKRVRVGEVDSKGSAADIDVIEVPNGRKSSFVVYMERQS